MKNNLKILTSLWFLIGLVLLLLNDFIFKEIYGNWLTGKLSDFAGLFIFPLFWTAIFPKNKNKIFLLTAVFFIFWKSPYSQSLLDSWNQFMFVDIARVVDYSDLMALIVLPLAYFYFEEKEDMKFLKVNPFFPLVVSSFAFVATSLPPEVYESVKNYSFSCSKDELKKRIFYLPAVENKWRKEYRFDTISGYYIGNKYNDSTKVENEIIQLFFQNKDSLWLAIQDSTIGRYYETLGVINGDDFQSSLELNLLSTGRRRGFFSNSKKVDKAILEKYLNSFETLIVNELKKECP